MQSQGGSSPLRNILKQSMFLTGLIKAARLIPLDTRRFFWWLKRPGAIRSYLATHEVRKLQIGAGFNSLPGWLNTDLAPKSASVIYLDAAKPFPFADGTFDYIFSEHVIEHIPYPQGLSMLKECFRVIKPGGRIRIATPNLEQIAGLSTPNKTDIQQKYIDTTLGKYQPEIDLRDESFVINYFFWGFDHLFVYNPATLADALRRVGFVDIRRCSPGESADDNLRGVESHGRIIGDEMNGFETMVLEGTRH
jgi:SAM-dependent methyltransferase